jgi:amidohydrolase
MIGDDVSEFTSLVPGVHAFIGSKNKGSDFPHHHPRFDIDEDCLPIGTEMFVRMALKFLNGDNWAEG